MVSAGFVQVADFVYSLTERGCEFLKLYKTFHRRYVGVQKSLKISWEQEKLVLMCVKPSWLVMLTQLLSEVNS